MRTPKHVRIGGPERLALAVHVVGSGVFSRGGVDQRIRTGEMMLVDLTAPYDFAWSGRGASQAFQIDYDVLGLSVETIRAAARRLPSSPLYDLMLHHLTVLPGIISTLQGTDAADMVGTATTQLLRALLTSAADDDVQQPPAMADVLFTRITWYARQHLTDLDLTAARIAAEHNISLRYLYKLYVELPQPVDHLRGRDLVGGVVPVPTERIDRGRLQQPTLVIAAKGPHAQMGELRELADRQAAVHPATVHPLPGRESTS